MSRIIELETDRLRLRQWRESDYPLFSNLNSDPEVMKYFPELLSKEDSDCLAIKLQSLIQDRGWGLWALELKSTNQFIGYTGLHHTNEELIFSPAIEIGWRLSKSHWKQGYATEAAKAVLKFAFISLQLEEIVSFTSVINKNSIAVMQRINMKDTLSNFKHPKIAVDNKLSEHVLYKITSENWSHY